MAGVDTREPDVHALVLPRERAAAKLRAGRPLLHDEPVILDLEFASDLFLRLAGERGFDLGRPLDLPAILTEAFVQHADHVRQLAGASGADAEAMAELADDAVKPLRQAYAHRLRALVQEWHRGYCPICGASPSVDNSTGAAPVQHGDIDGEPGQPGDAGGPGQLGDEKGRAASEATRRELQCLACGCSWWAEAPEPPFRIELALPADDDA